MRDKTRSDDMFNIDQMPKGYRFVPDDEQLIRCYLEKKVNREPVPRVIQDMFADDFYDKPPSHYGNVAKNETGFYFLFCDEPYFHGECKTFRIIGKAIGIWIPDAYEDPIYDGGGNIIGYKMVFNYFSTQELTQILQIWNLKKNMNKETDQMNKSSSWTMTLYRLNNACPSVFGKKDEWVLARLIEQRS